MSFPTIPLEKSFEFCYDLLVITVFVKEADVEWVKVSTG